MAHKKKTVKKVSETPAEPVIEQVRNNDPAQPQSGDLQGLSDISDADSESVRELVEEGQYFEASVISGVENAPDADAGPVHTHERNEDDVPPEYREQPHDEPRE
jgi:hypothetical protein